jgi:dihydrofolate synthase/folylpolyglutamate synthase
LDYKECVDFLFQQLPMYQNMGKVAFKKDLTNTISLLEYLGNPHQNNIKWIHVAGTNGKGTVSSILSSVLIEAGYKVGLYTSPHLIDFTERIRVNGITINEEAVIDFVERISPTIESIKPSFFEITVAMAFDYFNRSNIDFGVVEVGLGGRLDSTNVINPILSVITSIGMDHMDMLGNSIEEIAFEKAGIIKSNIPCVISKGISENAKKVIYGCASELKSAIIESETISDEIINKFPLSGDYQKQNISTALQAISVLNNLHYPISIENINSGLKNIVINSGLRGRWEIYNTKPLVILDTGHNIDGVSSNINQLKSQYSNNTIHVIWGMVNDKDRKTIFALLPKEWKYYSVKPQVPRGLDSDVLASEMNSNKLNVQVFQHTNEAYNYLIDSVDENDLIFIGGSTFVVADFLLTQKI